MKASNNDCWEPSIKCVTLDNSYSSMSACKYNPRPYCHHLSTAHDMIPYTATVKERNHQVNSYFVYFTRISDIFFK